MKHDIHLLKSHLDFKRLSSLHQLPHLVLSKEMKEKLHLKKQNMHVSKQFLYLHFYVYKSYLCHPRNSWPPFSKYKYMYFSLQRKYMVCLLFTNNMRHNMYIALRIYCPFLLQFLSTGLVQRNCTSHQQCFSAYIKLEHCILGPEDPKQEAAASISCVMSGLTRFRYYFPSHSRR